MDGYIAMEKGKYGFGNRRFTGMILFGDTDAFVKNSRFYLSEINGVKCVGFLDGTWVDGIFGDGMFGPSGIWNNGTWNAGVFQGRIWKNGNWKGGIYEGGKCLNVVGDIHSKDNQCFMAK